MIVNTAQGGGSSAKLNVLCQPDLPTDKFDGILLQTATKETLKKVIFDDSPWAAGSWIDLGITYPWSLENASSIEVDGLIYILGGDISSSGAVYSTFYRFTPSTKEFTELAYYSGNPYGIHCATLAYYNGFIYIFGGGYWNQQNYNIRKCYKYSIANNTYTQIADLPVDLTSGSAVVKDGIIYIFGTNGFINYKYDPVQNTFTQIATTLTPVNSCGCALFNGFIYVFGGKFGNTDTSKFAYKYDPVANTFTHITDLPFQMYGVHCFTIGDSIYLFGYTGYKKAYKYIPSTDSYTELAVPPTFLDATAPGIVANMIYFFGENGGHTTVPIYSLQAKQYAYSPALIIDNGSKILSAMILANKLCDGVPVVFRDAMLFKDGNLTFPALYVGNGTQWVKEREAQ